MRHKTWKMKGTPPAICARYQTAHRLELNPSSGNASNNQSAYGRRLAPEISFKCRLMNSGEGCAHGRHTFTTRQTDKQTDWIVKVGVHFCLTAQPCAREKLGIKWLLQKRTTPPDMPGHSGQVHSSETIRR